MDRKHFNMTDWATFVFLAELLAPRWRAIALDQCGHGHSGHTTTYDGRCF